MTNKEKRQYYKERSFERLGETRINNMGSVMTIIDYKNYNNVTVEFENGYITKTIYGNFVRGSVKNPYDKTTYGVGYIGEGKYKATVKGKATKEYAVWSSMFERCYSLKYQQREPTYKGCKICDKWMNFQEFGKWFSENYYEIIGQKMHIDKDILIKGNKTYSPLTCVFVPQDINKLFTKADSIRNNLPIGVYLWQFKNRKTCYTAQCRDGKIQKRLGYFNTSHKAFLAYKKYKEELIKETANKYRGRIPEKLYNAMMNYEVSEED
ncbi:hypothetical protein [Clostridium coskatii]|nr:hypothetical protein [Clostridium coskatii]